MREKKVHSILFTNNNNKSFEIKAKYFVLALGAFENVRMLKFFFEHFNFRWQKFLGTKWTDHLNAYSLGNYLIFNQNKFFSNEQHVVGVSLYDKILEQEKLPQAILKFEKKSLKKCNLPKKILDNLYGYNFFNPCFGEINGNFDNQFNGAGNMLSLSKDKKCKFNIPLLEVINRNDGFDERIIKKYVSKIAKIFINSNLGRIRISDQIRQVAYKGESLHKWSYHQMMGSPIGNNSTDGVVNKNLKVFDVENLYTVGSNVFNKTLSGKNPTYLIVLLSIRLASYLNNLKV